jgi:hypothetical protein
MRILPAICYFLHLLQRTYSTDTPEKHQLKKRKLTTMSSADTMQPLYTNKFELDLVRGKAPSERQKVTMEAIAERHQNEDHFISGIPFQNFSDGDGIGPSTGQVLLFKPSAKVHKVAFGPEFLAVRISAEIQDMAGGLNDANVQAKTAELNDLVPVYAPAGRALSLSCKASATGPETRAWAPELGPTGRAGITKSTDGRQSRYFVVVHASPDLINRELKKWVHDSDMTYGELVKSPVFNFAREAVKRNAQRIMADIRSQFRMKIGRGVPSDAGAKVEPYEMPPNLVTPDDRMYTSTVRPVYHEGKNMVAVFNNVIPAEDCAQRIIIDQGPWAGYLMYDTRNAGPVLGFPASTVVRRHPATIKNTASDTRAVNERADYFTWETKPVATGVTPETFPVCLLDNVYEAVDDSEHFMDTMKALGLRKTVPLAKLLPVAMKVPKGDEVRLRV